MNLDYETSEAIREAPGPAEEAKGESLLLERRADGRLWAAPRVYVGDSAGWRFLPAKGLTYTIMANARRVAEHLLRDLRAAS